MELDELHVLQHGARPKRHRHPVAGRVRRIGRSGKDLSCSAGGQHDGPGRQEEPSPGMLVKDKRPGAAAAFDDQVDGKMIVQPLDASLPHRFTDQHAHHLVSGRVAASSQDTASAVRRFASEGKFASGFVELGAPSDEFLNPCRPLFDQHAHRLLAAQPMTGFERVGQMNSDVVLFAQRDRDTALCMNRTALEGMALGQHQHPTASAEFDSCTQTGDAAADDEKVGCGRRW